jgi:hypothetical protein
MIGTTTQETMDHILTNFNWWVGYCNENTAKTIRKRHADGKLSIKTYEKVFAHHGFKKNLTWSR